ncbi:hypothetical protein [Variovorax sp. LG9.2]|uniref:hypothetical protein n=1 Tax=Variovorax sp. LG9.2 TaxID=3048626 RepID=UPI002B229C8D|nr:hypothetical protein [Variovorax sp. LG9.2]MEB0058448.1 hypothetical protein [Variovorax sp. LG9.2]
MTVAMDVCTRVALFGTKEIPADAIALQAGPLSLRLQGTKLLALRAGGHEVWHGVAFVYRSAGWATPESIVDVCKTRIGVSDFSVDIQAHFAVAPRIDLHIRIEGDVSGRVRYEGTAVAQEDIATQRTGLCVMHPMSAMGRAVEIGHDDGRTSFSTFPRLVPPWPPFMLVKSLRHEFADGAWASCRLFGESFEFEDQRNNADASFKVYGRSNSMPRPYCLRAGVPLTQRVELEVGRVPFPAQAVEGPAFAVGTALDRCPAIGIGLAPEQLVEDGQLLAKVKALSPIQIHLVLDSPHDVVDFDVLEKCVVASGRPLRLDIRVVTVSSAARIMSLGRLLQERGIHAEAVAGFPATHSMVAVLRDAFPGAAIGGGTPYFFAQFNRVENLGPVNFLSFTVSAIVHGADDQSPMDGLQSLPSLIDTARTRHPEVAVRVGPSGIAAPRSPLGDQPASDGTRRIALARRDPRSGALYGAAWMIGHIGTLAQCALQAVSVWGFGPGEGLFFGDDASSVQLTPAGWVLREIRGASSVLRVHVTHPASSAAFAFVRPGASIVLMANLSETALWIRTESLSAGVLHLLDAHAWIEHHEGRHPDPWRAVASTEDCVCHLPAFAVARLVIPSASEHAFKR